MADFMDCSIVIPPTEIQDESMLQSLINFQKMMLRQRLRPSDTRLLFDSLAGDSILSEGPSHVCCIIVQKWTQRLKWALLF